MEELEARMADPPRLRGQNRLRLVGTGCVVCFVAIGVQLALLTLWHGRGSIEHTASLGADRVPRPDIVDRNGIVLASDITVASLYVDPRKIIDVDDAVELLTATLPDLNAKTLRQRLSLPNRAFVWLKREVSPAEREAIHARGIPGKGFRMETRRV
jgi:cell division protein FtsI (penicillin-binding protein 3)